MKNLLSHVYKHFWQIMTRVFGLSAIWIGMWAAYVFAVRSTPIEPEAFKLVASLDLTFIVPVLATGGLLLWRRRPWGFIIAAMAGVLASLYLFVLTVNSFVAINRGLAESPGELPVWGTLLTATAIATVLLITSARSNLMK